MKKLLGIVVLGLLIASPAFAFNEFMIKQQKRFKNSELVKILSYRAFDFYSIQEGWYKKSPSEFDALIIYPKGKGPFPLVMVSHSSWGPEEFYSKWMTWHKRQAKKLQKKGIATMFIDHFTARDQLGSTAGNQFTVNIWSQFLDPFIALEYLSKNPKINIKKVGIQGGSRGGMVSILASEKRLRNALISKDLYFAASMPLYPDCEDVGMFRNPQPTKETKTWMILGGSDNYTRAEPCVELGKKIKANGGDIIVDVKKGWRHDFIGNYEVEDMEYSQIFWKCPKWYTEDDGKMSKSYMDFLLEYVDRWETEEDFYKMSREDPLRTLKFSFDPYNLSGCMFKGAKGGGDKGKQIFNKNIKFWEENLLK